ncbi:MAG TPA: cytochrome C [Desulfobulbaceae bacterium]|nr:cytochrome C [Desulfobulbaceae bacterium]
MMLYLTLIILTTGCVAHEKNGDPIKPSVPTSLSDLEQLGRKLYFDAFLSSPPGQACATCHDPASGWTGPRSDINQGGAVYPGAMEVRFGNRKPPSAAYATPSPALHYDDEEGLFLGGNFWDGRATGWLLGEPAAEQAQGPFLNPVEHNLPDAATVVKKVCGSAYGNEFRAIYGKNICANVVNAFNAIGQALFAYENSVELNAFSSKYDHFLRDPVQYPLTAQELLGLKLFENEDKGKCAECHPSAPGADGSPPLFTDFSYDNLGFPKNPENPTYRMPREFNPDGAAWVDPGLGGFLADVPRFAHLAEENKGRHKVPTLRNVDQRPHAGFVKSYGHNGVFKSLKEIMHFYNTRDVLPACEATPDAKPGLNCWPRPEVAANLNTEELGNLGLSEEEEWAIVAFMQTLNDGWMPGGK